MTFSWTNPQIYNGDNNIFRCAIPLSYPVQAVVTVVDAL